MINRACWKFVLRLIVLLLSDVNVFGSDAFCKSKFGIFNQDQFNTHACGWCYFFLFPEYDFKPHNLFLVANSSAYPQAIRVVPDSTNAQTSKIVCSSLTSDECVRWKSCCSAARDCCRQQLQTHGTHINDTCPPTWDGFSCWNAGVPGETSLITCPNFLPYSIPTRSAIKTCQEDGTWLQRGGHDWTDYTPCLSYQELKVSIYISLGCQIASLLCLLPSVFIFIKFKTLLHQHRIRLHVNFFVSLILRGMFTILWNMAVTFDRITNNNVTDTLLYKNSAHCKVLSFMKLYFTSTTYVWMFCEGLYLHKLVVNAFSPPKCLTLFYILGWGYPLLYTSAYAVVRVTMANESCWAKSMGDKEWIIYAPNLFCLLANVYFLCCILRILLTQLQVHPNEPSNFRKALKATFVLIPLFGVYLVVTIYRLPPGYPGSLYYEHFSEFVSNTQGMIVAIVFCLCNGEVISLIKFSRNRRRHTHENGRGKVNSCTSLNLNTFAASPYNSIHEKISPNRSLLPLKRKEETEISVV